MRKLGNDGRDVFKFFPRRTFQVTVGNADGKCGGKRKGLKGSSQYFFGDLPLESDQV